MEALEDDLKATQVVLTRPHRIFPRGLGTQQLFISHAAPENLDSFAASARSPLAAILGQESPRSGAVFFVQLQWSRLSRCEETRQERTDSVKEETLHR